MRNKEQIISELKERAEEKLSDEETEISEISLAKNLSVNFSPVIICGSKTNR